MSSFRDTHHRYSLALTAVLAIILGILLIVLGTAEDADGRGQPPVGSGQGGVDLVQVGGGGFASPVNVASAPAERTRSTLSSGEVYATSLDGPVYRLEPLP